MWAKRLFKWFKLLLAPAARTNLQHKALAQSIRNVLDISILKAFCSGHLSSDFIQGYCNEQWLSKPCVDFFWWTVFHVLMFWAKLLSVFSSHCVPTVPSIFVTYRELMLTAQNRKCHVIALLSWAKVSALTGHGDSEITGPRWPWPRQMHTLQCSSVSYIRGGGGGVWIFSEIPDSVGHVHYS